MRTHRAKRTAAFWAAVLFAAIVIAMVVAVALDPYRLVRAEFIRQRIAAGLARDSIEVAGHHWVYAYSDAAPQGAPTVVMIHGFTGSKENWYPLAQRLRGKYRLLIPDLPGWGESERKPGADYGYVAQAERVTAFARALSPEPAGRPARSFHGRRRRRDGRSAQSATSSRASGCSTPPACASTTTGSAARCWPARIRSAYRTRRHCDAISTRRSSTRPSSRGCRGPHRKA